jgi:hypothetical protein
MKLRRPAHLAGLEHPLPHPEVRDPLRLRHLIGVFPHLALDALEP